MNPDSIVLSHILGILDYVGSMLMLWSATRITTAAGFRNSFALWALVRRVVYFEMTVALFDLGCIRFSDGAPSPWTGPFAEFASMCGLLLGIIVFPALRATGWITQDSFQTAQGFSQGQLKRPTVNGA